MRRRQSYDESSIRTIISQARRIERLSTDLQQVVHLESGQLELRPSQINLSQVICDAVNHIRISAPEFAFIADVPDEPVMGNCDRIRISQVIDNLLLNAVKYSPEAGTIMVSVIADKSDARIQVMDQGVGISIERQNHLFTRFYRADKDGAASGLGLGLYISRMLTEAHGGSIHAQSRPGEGSTFTVRLPRDADSGNDTPLVIAPESHAAS